ncbi:hypothetical protein CBQ26_13830 [Deinococcus indicus]|uniref:DarT domain-containing protein n=1 Tax=Deinococcus indicus TaxID=223556 RepID=A0A246BIP8_9DEIO|nr:DUF4433 domain-containing protein [Deinococcus indicus]OWL95126.1 hypothetical protein CBQ26_13830 [Deinococcus indicus]
MKLPPARKALGATGKDIHPLGNDKNYLVLHITPFEALDSVLRSGYLLPKNQVVPVQDISNPEIQNIRAGLKPPDPPGGTLHDYVPFYFGHHSPMLLQLATGRISHFKGDQRDIVYCISSVQEVQRAGLAFTFTDGHGIVAFTRFFTDVNDLDQVDWSVVHQNYWQDTQMDNDRQRRKQAEFLVKDKLPLSALLGFAVADTDMQTAVNGLLAQYPQYTFQVPTKVRSDWYYERHLTRRR